MLNLQAQYTNKKHMLNKMWQPFTDQLQNKTKTNTIFSVYHNVGNDYCSTGICDNNDAKDRTNF